MLLQKKLSVILGDCSDNRTEDFICSDNPEDGLKLTRALNVKKVADEAGDDIRKAEASVSFKSGM